jgi:hypothetical protein
LVRVCGDDGHGFKRCGGWGWREARKQGGSSGRLWKEFRPLYFIHDLLLLLFCMFMKLRMPFVLGRTHEMVMAGDSDMLLRH